ncbi:MAG: peptidoglycan D,D-transpeptidase FtsI family protein [Planctomycetota bacterium]|jgi:cell division protein FtsI/penicillin-binding protein 2
MKLGFVETLGAQARAKRVFALLLAALAALVLRAGWIQLVRGDEFERRARRQHFRQVEVQAARGKILDRCGRILAVDYHSRSIAVDPQVISDPSAYSAKMAFLIGDPGAAPHLARRIAERRRSGTRFAYLERWADRPVAERVSKSRLEGLDLREEPRREYPHGALAFSVLGAVGSEDGEIQGLTGLEHLYDSLLRGVDGTCSVFRAGGGRRLHLFPECDRKPSAGHDLHTTLDLVLQSVVEEALDGLQEQFAPQCSCALVLDVRNGEILALAGRPALDPAAFPNVPEECLRVPAVHCTYELGSTIKPLIMAWALTRGAVQPGQLIDCGPGVKYFGRRPIRDVKPNHVLPLEQILVKSSNIGMAQVSQALGIDETYRYLRALGIGRPTGVEIPGEESGRMTPRKEWRRNYTLASVGFGRELMLTPLQLAAAYGALLNGGYLWQPTLIRSPSPGRAAPRRIPFSPRALAFVRAALEKVVEEGTGRRARIRGLRVGGKTGTSKAYFEEDKYVSSFVGFAPAENPQVVVLVAAEGPKKVDGVRPYGGVVAAPVAREILRRGIPLVPCDRNVALPESGVRHLKNAEGKVCDAAVHWSSVYARGRTSQAIGRNPDSAGAQRDCRSDG